VSYLTDRAERAGIRSGLVLENVGRGPDAGSIHRGLEKSPGHRRNILYRNARGLLKRFPWFDSIWNKAVKQPVP